MVRIITDLPSPNLMGGGGGRGKDEEWMCRRRDIPEYSILCEKYLLNTSEICLQQSDQEVGKEGSKGKKEERRKEEGGEEE